MFKLYHRSYHFSSLDGEWKMRNFGGRSLGKSRGMSGANFLIERVRRRYVHHPVTQFTYARAQPHEILIRLTISDRRWTTVQVPFTGLRAGLHPTVEFAATPEESRRSGGAGEEPAVPLQHLRQGLRHGVQPPYSHVEGQSCMYQIRRPNSQKFAKNSRGAGKLTKGVRESMERRKRSIDIDLSSRVKYFR